MASKTKDTMAAQGQGTDVVGGKVELAHYQGPVWLRYKATTTLPLDTVWKVVLNSLDTYWSPVVRSASITARTSTLIDQDDGEPHVGECKGSALAEKYEKLVWTRPKDARWQTSRKCEVAYTLHEDLAQAGVRVETTHTVKVENGQTVYVLEEAVSGDGVCATLAARIGGAWQETLDKAVLSMGDAVVQRAVFVDVNGKPSSKAPRRLSLFK